MLKTGFLNSTALLYLAYSAATAVLAARFPISPPASINSTSPIMATISTTVSTSGSVKLPAATIIAAARLRCAVPSETTERVSIPGPPSK